MQGITRFTLRGGLFVMFDSKEIGTKQVLCWVYIVSKTESNIRLVALWDVIEYLKNPEIF